MHFADPGHPIWRLMRLVILMVTLCTVLYFSASKFDYTEVQSIILIFAAMAGIEGISMLIPTGNKD